MDNLIQAYSYTLGLTLENEIIKAKALTALGQEIAMSQAFSQMGV